MDQTTFYQQESQEKQKPATSSVRSDLVKIKLHLLNVINNVALSSYGQMREIRKKYLSLCKNKDLFTSDDQQESVQIRNLLMKIKQTHPEICSKEQFVKAINYKCLVSSFAGFTQPSEDVHLSQNLMTTLVTQSNYEHLPKEENFDVFPSIDEVKAEGLEDLLCADENENSLTNEADQKICQYLLWAVELREELKRYNE